jgi:hypothetical protein
MASRICQFAKKRTEIKIIKFGPQSEFCKSLVNLNSHFKAEAQGRGEKKAIIGNAQKVKEKRMRLPCPLDNRILSSSVVYVILFLKS